MFPPGDFIQGPPGDNGTFIHPWAVERTLAFQMGPTAIQDVSAGNLVRLWTAEAVDNLVWMSAEGVPPILVYTHTDPITDISVAFDQNGNLVIAFMDLPGACYYYWWDPLIPGYTTTTLDGFSPRVTLDDARPFNIPDSDVLLVYSRAGNIHYRLQRDRYGIEYTPLVDGTPEPAFVIYHISMTSASRVVFVYGSDINSSALNSFRFTSPPIMKNHVLKQKAPVEELPIQFDFGHVLSFGDSIISAAAVITVETGTDPNPGDMLDGTPTHTDVAVTQMVVGGLEGNVYRLAMSAGTSDGCIYVVEGLIYVNNSPGIPVAP